MGLDIAFDKEKAQKAGLEFRTMANGTAEEIQDHLAAIDAGEACADSCYLTWLQEERQHIKVSSCDFYVEAQDSGSDIIVRANKWGSTYHPLTDWLKEHDIEWSEF